MQSWKQRENGTISRRFPALNPALKREWCSSFSRQKEGSDYKEIDLLGRQIERLARVSRYMNSGNEADLNPNVANRNKGERKKPTKNYFSEDAIAKLEEIFMPSLSNINSAGTRPGLSIVFATF